MKIMVKFLIARHGQTKQNVEGVAQGKDDGEITEQGHKQIQRLVQRLKKEKISGIISSNLLRCKITTEKILKEIKTPVKYTSLIREKDNGNLVGKSYEEFSWDDLPGTFEARKAPEGESLEDVRERGRNFFEEILERYREDESIILIVSHGTFLRVFIGNLLGMSLYDSIFKLFIEHCSLTELEINPRYKEGYRFNFINDISHLNK
jgi:broad specificity phosphatase PhoE